VTEQRAAFDRAIDAWNAGDLARYLELYHDRIQLHGYSEQPMGKPEVKAFYEAIFDSLSDIELEIHEVIEQGDQLRCWFTMHGTHTGELAGVAATGRGISQPGFTIVRFEGDQIVERHSVADFGTVVAQLTAP
jgi:steroid delta-isomerase-like uncharacterized protein